MIPTAVRGWGRQKPPQGAQIDWTHPLAKNLVALWTFNGGGFDATRTGNTLSSVNNAAYGAGRFGAAATSLTVASSQCWTIADNAALSMGDIDFSICAWVNPSTIGTAQAVIGKYGGGTGQTVEYEIRLLNTGLMRWFVGSNTTYGQVSASTFGALSSNTWYCVIAVHDSVANTLYVEINGVGDSQGYSGGSYDGTFSVSIGATAQGANTFWGGRIDYVSIYKSAAGAGGALNTTLRKQLAQEPFAFFQRPAGAQFAFSTFNPAWAMGSNVLIGGARQTL